MSLSMEQRNLEEIHRSWRRQPTLTELRRTKNVCKLSICTFAMVVTTICVAVLVTKGTHHHKQRTHPPNTYTIALEKALYFFNAQRSGELPMHNNVSWRGDSCLRDGDGFYDLMGGYFDAGDAIKSSFRMSFSMTILSWSVIEYRENYEAAGELYHVKGLIKWGTDYLLNTFDCDSETIYSLVSQVGSQKTREASVVPNDQNCWMRPEDIDYKRHVSICHGDCSDLAGEMAASLASASIVFKDNKAYSQKLLDGATKLYRFADSSTYWDDLLWVTTWMFYATGDLAHLHRITNHHLANRAGAFSFGPSYGVLSWSKKLVGAQLLLTRLRLFLGPGYPYEEMLREFHNQTGTVMCSYLPYFNKFNRTKGGLILLNHGEPQPLQYAATAAFLASLFSDYLEAANTPGWYCGPTFYSNDILSQFSRFQLDYILGKNPQNMSYLVGFGERYPTHVHHRGASIPKNKKVSCQGGWIWKESSKGNPNTIVGAMVAGPDKHDGFHDDRTDYNYTEPTLAGNAGLVAALVALSGDKGVSGAIDVNTIFNAIDVRLMFPDTPPPPAAWRP